MAHGANGFQKKGKVLGNEEKMALWKKLQMKYTAEIEYINQLIKMDQTFIGEVSQETKQKSQELYERIMKENT